jgi:hypothetical protein
MEYVPIPNFTKAEMENAITDDDIEKLMFVPLFASLYYEDRNFAREICIKLSEHSNFNVRAMAIEGFGHIARIDGKLNKEIAKPIIEKALKDEYEFVRQKAEDAKDDIKHFLKWKFNK